MKVLIIGANSYIGQALKTYFANDSSHEVEIVSVRNDNWKESSWKGFDVIICAIGLAHVKEEDSNRNAFYKINRDLSLALAQKGKDAGAVQFIYLSSMSVYGMYLGEIDENTKPVPDSAYGLSKLQGEQQIMELQEEDYTISLPRIPMVYGEGCKGNYQLLKKFAKYSPIFPNFENKRSMIGIAKLCKEIDAIAINKQSGVILVQDDEYICTAKMVQQIGNDNGHHIFLVKGFNTIIKGLIKLRIPLICKVFGDSYYKRIP